MNGNNSTHVPMFGDAIKSIHTVLIVLINQSVQNMRSLEMVLAEECPVCARLCNQTKLVAL